MRLKRRNKRNEREREPEAFTKEEPKDPKDQLMYMYFENEEEMEWYIKYHKIKNFEYAGHQPRTIIFPASEVLKELKEK